MPYGKLISHINSKNWYRQGVAVKLLYISYPCQACSHFTVNRKPIAPYYFGYVFFVQNDFMSFYFSREVTKKVCDFYITRQNNNLTFLKDLKADWEKKQFNQVVRDSKKLERTYLSLLPLADVIAGFEQFSNVYQAAWRESIFLDAFDIHSEHIANQVVKKNKLRITQDQLQVLTSVNELSLAQKAKLELFGLLKKKRNLPKQLQKYAEKWYWLQNDYYLIKKLPPSYFHKELLALKKNNTVLENEKIIFSQFKANQKLQKKLHQSIKSNAKAAALLDGLATLAAWRDRRKNLNQIAGQAVKKYAREIAKRMKVKLSQVENMHFDELISAAKNHQYAHRLIVTRKKENLLTNYPGRTVNTVPIKKNELKLKALLDSFIVRENLTGSTAYPGLVRGTVKIMLSRKDFHKMRKGDILVAPNTRPEYVPIIKIAGAIISEEGGITSHSAIVSRELKIPCLVGVQGAIDQLKDGDVVEIDANRGIVKKL
jgi:phosphohistidine swiveling domain-containing protein